MKIDNLKDLKHAVARIMQDKVEVGEIAIAEWATNEVMGDIPDVHGDDAHIYITATRLYVYEAAKASIKRYEGNSQDKDEQLVLDGFKHLQKAYPVIRKRVKAICPIEKMTEDELRARAEEYIKMATGCTEHAEELFQYIASRFSLSA